MYLPAFRVFKGIFVDLYNYLKIKMLGLRTTIYKVADLQKAKEWYEKVFDVKPYFDEPFYVGFNIKGYELGLLPEETSLDKSDNVLSYWGVDNVQETCSHFLNLGATEHEKPTNVGGELIVASVRDPWNNVVGFIYNPDFKLSS
jgi:lactoylglutathione lyase